jgi:hypothetical protein
VVGSPDNSKLFGHKYTNQMKKTLVILSAVCLAAGAANAQNLLLNGDFNDPASGSAPTSWSSWNWGNSWANHENNPGATYDGSYYLVCGNAWMEGGAGFFQTVSATAGQTYQLDVLSGADAWWKPKGTMTMFFLDSSDLTLDTATRNTVDPAVYGDLNDIAHPWASYSLTGTAPVGTTQIKVEFASAMPIYNGGSVWFENASLTAAPVPEPATAALIALGSAALIGFRSRRK